MATNLEVRSALNMLNNHIRKISSWNTPVPTEEILKQKVLSGDLCTGCEFFDASAKKHRMPRVIVNCSLGHDPKVLYRAVDLNDPDCTDYKSKNGNGGE